MGEWDEVWRRLKALAASHGEGISRSAAEAEVAAMLYAVKFYHVPAEAFQFYVAELERLTDDLRTKKVRLETTVDVVLAPRTEIGHGMLFSLHAAHLLLGKPLQGDATSPSVRWPCGCSGVVSPKVEDTVRIRWCWEHREVLLTA
jgi:hypothetical protein